MTRPGSRLRALATRICSTRAVLRSIDPTIADLWLEYNEATRREHVWRARWIRVTGTLRLLQVMLWHVRDDWGHSVGAGAAALVLSSAVLMALVFSHVPEEARSMWPHLLVYLVPSTVPVTLPWALCVTALFAGERRRSALMLASAACAVGVFLTLAWITPEANSRFRDIIASAMGVQFVGDGVNELTMPELYRHLIAGVGVPDPDDIGAVVRAFDGRIAIPLSAMILTLLGLALSGCARGTRRVAATFGWTCYLALYVVPPEALVMLDAVSPRLIVWVPNLAAMMLWALLQVRARQAR